MSKGFGVPDYGVGNLAGTPRGAAIARISYRAVIRPGGFLRWSVKANIRDCGANSYRHTKRLDGAIEVLVVDGVFIMPDAGGRICHLVTY